MNEKRKPKPGEIISAQAYAQGKMIDHSGLNFHGRGTPSDIDAVGSIGRRMLFFEFSSSCVDWKELQKGQRLMYEFAVQNGGGFIWAALLKHSVPSSRQIRSDRDVEAFQVMKLQHGTGKLITSDVAFVQKTFRWVRFYWHFLKAEIFREQKRPDLELKALRFAWSITLKGYLSRMAGDEWYNDDELSVPPECRTSKEIELYEAIKAEHERPVYEQAKRSSMPTAEEAVGTADEWGMSEEAHARMLQKGS